MRAITSIGSTTKGIFRWIVLWLLLLYYSQSTAIFAVSVSNQRTRRQFGMSVGSKRLFIAVMLSVLAFFSSQVRAVKASTRSGSSAFVATRHARASSNPRLSRQFGLVGDSYTGGHYSYSNRDPNVRLFASSTNVPQDDSSDGKKKASSSATRKKKPSPPISKKIKVKEITKENIDKLAAAFDELARQEGFDSSTARHADDDTFEDFFDDDDDEEDDDEQVLATKADRGESKADEWDLDDILDSSKFDVDDFDEEKVAVQRNRKEKGKTAALEMDVVDVDDDDDDDDFLDFGGGDDDDMDARIAAAQRDLSSGRVTVPQDLDRYASNTVDLSKLGFRRELNPFGNDETPRREGFRLITNAMTCSACGSDFQCRNEQRPGYLPPEKFEIQTKLSKIEAMQQLKEKAESAEWTPEDEVEYLIQASSGASSSDMADHADIDIDAMAAEMGLDLVELAKKKVICKRCHGLQNFGKVETSLRPGWTDEPTLSQEQFRELLKPISQKPAVIIALVDLFDFSGSVLRELDGIAGENPVILAANKVDLLPPKMGKQRAENWVRRELEYMGVKSLANVGGSVRLISCKTGAGVSEMLEKARNLADELEGDVYVVGAANAGKSTLINRLLGHDDEDKPTGKKRAGNRNAFKGALTTSPLPGTTLKFIKVDLGDGKSIYDTPGLLVPGTFTQLLTPEELKIVCPKKPVEPITFRVEAGKCVLVGGLARIEVIGDSLPFLFTFFVANDVKLHPTSSSKADEFIKNHAGGMLTPPLEPGIQRMAELGEFHSHVIDIEGAGWKEAAADLTLTGLGWVAVTGAGSVKVKVSVPKGIGVAVRPPLMPFDVWEVAAKYTGAKAVRKAGRTKSGKRRKGVGRN